MDLGQNPNQSPLFYKWDGEPPGPAQACLSPFPNQLFPSVSGTFHPPAGQSPTQAKQKSRHVRKFSFETNTLYFKHECCDICIMFTHILQCFCQLPAAIATFCCCQFIPLPSYSTSLHFVLGQL